MVLTLHDLTRAARGCDRLVVLDRGRVVADGPPCEALSTAVLLNAFNLSGDWLETPGRPGAVGASGRR